MLKGPDLEQARISALPLRKSCDLGQGPQVSHQFIVLPLQARNDHEDQLGRVGTIEREPLTHSLVHVDL